jgi:O-glycosyl hydrolase
MKSFYKLCCFFLSTLNCIAQLPIQDGAIEVTTGTDFAYWTNQANNTAVAQFAIQTNNLIAGSTKAIQTDITSLGDFEYSIQSKSTHSFSVAAESKLTISFYAKSSGSAQIKLCISGPTIGPTVFKGHTFNVEPNWKQYVHTFNISESVSNYKISFRYLTANTTYSLDEVNAMPGPSVVLHTNERFQKIDGWGGGIKRRTKDLAALSATKRAQIEKLAYQDLNINMIRLFIHHTLENNANDNTDPNSINMDAINWTYYNHNDISNPFSHFVVNTLQQAISLSNVGIDYIIGNSNTAPGWMKKNGSHKRASEDESVLLNTLEDGMVDEFTEYILIFLTGMKNMFGIDVTEVSITNEPDYLNTYESMNVTPTDLLEIIPSLRAKLDQTGFSSVRIVSPEAARVAPGSGNADALTAINSTASYISTMFQDATTKSAIDVIGTHTYYDSSHNADWSMLTDVSDQKPIWVTESGNLKSLDMSMTDAANYIKWISRGFNGGELTGYMSHLLFEEHKYETLNIADDKEGSSALVLWDQDGIILPKRYHVMKQFINLSGKDYVRIGHTNNNFGMYSTSFISPENDEIVLHVFNEQTEPISFALDIPNSLTSFTQYRTSDTEDFTQSSLTVPQNTRYLETSLPAMSFTSYVYQLSQVLNANDQLDNAAASINIYPNPSNGLVYVMNASAKMNYDVYTLNGQSLFTQAGGAVLDLQALPKGVYLLEVKSGEQKICKKLMLQ